MMIVVIFLKLTSWPIYLVSDSCSDEVNCTVHKKVILTMNQDTTHKRLSTF